MLLMGSPEIGLMRLVARCFWMELRSYVYPSAATTGFVNGTYEHAPCSQHLCDGVAEVTPDGGERLRHFFDLSNLAAPVRPLLLL